MGWENQVFVDFATVAAEAAHLGFLALLRKCFNTNGTGDGNRTLNHNFINSQYIAINRHIKQRFCQFVSIYVNFDDLFVTICYYCAPIWLVPTAVSATAPRRAWQADQDSSTGTRQPQMPTSSPLRIHAGFHRCLRIRPTASRAHSHFRIRMTHRFLSISGHHHTGVTSARLLRYRALGG